MTRTIYRNKKTGRFASKSTWKRNKAKGGTRYVRQRIEVKKRKPPKPPLPPSAPVWEWIVSVQPSAASDRSFDVLVTARDEAEAFIVARKFLRDDIRGQRIIAAGGWYDAVAAKGEQSNEEAGEAEYRPESRRSRRSKK